MYILARIFAFLVLVPFFFLTVKGKENLRVKGGAIIIANHTSNWDPVVLGFSVKHKPVCYLAKEELYKNVIVRRILLSLHTIPLARGKGDVHAVKAAVFALNAQKILGIFPEGTRSKTKTLLPFQPGAALLALKTSVPIIPVYIKGEYKLFRKITVYAGEPIFLKDITGDKPTSENIKAGTKVLYCRLKDMIEKYG